ncbi:14227_t:CDS:2 [Cetraspora pellucida]|uniref:14227_t:CDS:1 n=1 Tax=Cetraspora pellucida TaxID=1433469 RepID=A0A9N8ZFE5_9GLOM|nr:14227_t:CDS:2 [Cetraspora pellucida]
MNMLIQPQQAQARDKRQQNIFDEKRHKKVVSHRRKPMENEKERQKAEYETSKHELKNLLAQFGTKAKVADELEKDVSKLHGNIESLLEKVQGKTNKFTQSPSTVIEQRHSNRLTTILRDKLYSNSNDDTINRMFCYFPNLDRSHNIYMYVEPYEPIVHGTYDTDQTETWKLLRTITNLIYDFFSEIMNGGRGFGSSNYDGSVPI